jgi:phospholipase/carboxylesterase
MRYDQTEIDSVIALRPRGTAPRGSVIWLHGLGADGSDFVPAVEALQLPSDLSLNFLFPHANPRPVTLNMGYIMRAWYDIRSLSGTNEDEEGIRESEAVVRRLMDEEISSGLRADQIILAGFSQGGAMALHTALRYEHALAGVLALSTYLPLAAKLPAEDHAANRGTSILMCHGTHDNVVPLRAGEQSRDALTSAGYNVDWRTWPMGHEVSLDQLVQIGRWLGERLP